MATIKSATIHCQAVLSDYYMYSSMETSIPNIPMKVFIYACPGIYSTVWLIVYRATTHSHTILTSNNAQGKGLRLLLLY